MVVWRFIDCKEGLSLIFVNSWCFHDDRRALHGIHEHLVGDLAFEACGPSIYPRLSDIGQYDIRHSLARYRLLELFLHLIFIDLVHIKLVTKLHFPLHNRRDDAFDLIRIDLLVFWLLLLRCVIR